VQQDATIQNIIMLIEIITTTTITVMRIITMDETRRTKRPAWNIPHW
jgi:hypothetical protein